jgi:type IV pilus assembly protein PilM
MKSFLWRSFPPPDYLLRPAAGLDLSDRSIKFVQLALTTQGLRVAKIGEQELPAGIIDGGDIKNSGKLIEVLKNFKDQHHLSWVACDMPEEHVYVVRLRLPQARPAELPGMIEVELPEHVPLSPEETVFDYSVAEIVADNKWLEVDVVAVNRAVAESYFLVLKSAGLLPLSFEPEGSALARALISPADSATTLIVDLGKVRTSLSIVAHGAVLDTVTIPEIGGDAFTELLVKNLNINFAAAEELKIKQGLARSDDERRQFLALVPLAAALRDEIKKRERFWCDHCVPENLVEPVSQVILTGGQATLPGLAEYLEANLGLPVKLGNPWSNVLSFNHDLPPVTFNESLKFGTAIGLAMRPFNFYHHD